MPECAAYVEDGMDALAAIRKQGDENQPTLRHAKAAQTQLLKIQQQSEETIVQLLDEAQMLAAEAHEDAAVVCNDHDDDAVVQDALNMDLLMKSAAARLADHERNTVRFVQ